MAEVDTAHQVGDGSGHELSDLSPRTISFFAVGLVALLIVVLGVGYGALVWLRHSTGQHVERPSPPSITQEPIPGPQLLVEPELAMKAMRHREEARLKTYGWIDQEKGIVHIPIERAIDMLADKGLPARPRPAQSTGESRAGKEAGARPGEAQR